MNVFHLEVLESLSIDTPWGPIVLVTMPQDDKGCLVGLHYPEGLKLVRHKPRDRQFDPVRN